MRIVFGLILLAAAAVVASDFGPTSTAVSSVDATIDTREFAESLSGETTVNTFPPGLMILMH